jgi:hypothetical protein
LEFVVAFATFEEGEVSFIVVDPLIDIIAMTISFGLKYYSDCSVVSADSLASLTLVMA